MSATSQSRSKALRQASRARHSLDAGAAAAKDAGSDWGWLADDLRKASEQVQHILTYARSKIAQEKATERMLRRVKL